MFNFCNTLRRSICSSIWIELGLLGDWRNQTNQTNQVNLLSGFRWSNPSSFLHCSSDKDSVRLWYIRRFDLVIASEHNRFMTLIDGNRMCVHANVQSTLLLIKYLYQFGWLMLQVESSFHGNAIR
jgi:hypothetical protein